MFVHKRWWEGDDDGAMVKAAKRLVGRDLRYCGKQHLEFLFDLQHTYRASKERVVMDQIEDVTTELFSRMRKKQSYRLREKQERKTQRELDWRTAHRHKAVV